MNKFSLFASFQFTTPGEESPTPLIKTNKQPSYPSCASLLELEPLKTSIEKDSVSKDNVEPYELQFFVAKHPDQDTFMFTFIPAEDYFDIALDEPNPTSELQTFVALGSTPTAIPNPNTDPLASDPDAYPLASASEEENPTFSQDQLIPFYDAGYSGRLSCIFSTMNQFPDRRGEQVLKKVIAGLNAYFTHQGLFFPPRHTQSTVQKKYIDFATLILSTSTSTPTDQDQLRRALARILNTYVDLKKITFMLEDKTMLLSQITSPTLFDKIALAIGYHQLAQNWYNRGHLANALQIIKLALAHYQSIDISERDTVCATWGGVFQTASNIDNDIQKLLLSILPLPMDDTSVLQLAP